PLGGGCCWRGWRAGIRGLSDAALVIRGASGIGRRYGGAAADLSRRRLPRRTTGVSVFPPELGQPVETGASPRLGKGRRSASQPWTPPRAFATLAKKRRT